MIELWQRQADGTYELWGHVADRYIPSDWSGRKLGKTFSFILHRDWWAEPLERADNSIVRSLPIMQVQPVRIYRDWKRLKSTSRTVLEVLRVPANAENYEGVWPARSSARQTAQPQGSR